MYFRKARNSSRLVTRSSLNPRCQNVPLAPNSCLARKEKPPFDKLHGSFDALATTQSNLRVEVIWHYHKIMQLVFTSVTIMEQHIDKQSGTALALQ